MERLQVLAVWLAVGIGVVFVRAAESPEAQQHFARGLTALHHFEYEEANEAFQQARTVDPGLVLAYWGEAMTYHQTLWRRENVELARRALTRLAPTPAARAARAGSEREKGLLGAVDALVGEGDAPTRQGRYADAMARLYAEYPDDPDIASLYALALIGSVSRGLIGYAPHAGADARQQGLAGSDVQRRAAAILEKTLASHPQHPGALHYLLHDYDDPEHARLALPAARAYATVAGGFSHALHMPAHIFLQLGQWREAAASDRAAYDASSEWVRRKRLPDTLKNFHALSWLQYELLQAGRFREAADMMREIEPVVKASGALTQGGPLLSDYASMRARYAIETRRWDLLGREQNFGNVDELFAVGMSAAYVNNGGLAERARGALAERAQSAQEGDLRPAIAIMERELAGVLAWTGGRRDEALTILRDAARAENALPPPLGPPAPVKPAPELLGELLLEAGQPREAAAAFADLLRRNANRSLAVLGLARAAAAMGDTATAQQRYRELLANYNGADAEVTEVTEVRKALDQAAASPSGRENRRAASLVVISALGVVAVIAFVRRRRAKGTEKTERTGSHRGTKKQSNQRRR